MGELLQQDLGRVVVRIPGPVRDLMRKNTIYLGGGFIRAVLAGEKPSDIDLFGADKEKLLMHGLVLATETGGKAHTTDNAITVLAPPRTPVQLITRWLFDDPVPLMKSFDFTIAKAIVWYDREEKKWQSLCDNRYYADLASRRLVYTFPTRDEEAGGSLMRVRKFLQRGYNIQAKNLAAVVARLVVRLDQEEQRDFTDERWVTDILTGLLHEVDPLMIVDGLELRDEHEIYKDETDSEEN